MIALGLTSASAFALAQTDSQVTNQTFVAFDIETTGLSREYGRIIEIGVVKFHNDHVIQRKSWLIQPGMPIPLATQRVHGITDDMVADAPPFPDVYQEFLDFIGDSVLIAHNARFDMSFIQAEALRHALPMPANPVIDTLRVARQRYPDAGSYNLEHLVQMLELPAGKHHRGMQDSDHLRELFLVMTPAHYATVDDLIAAGGLSFPLKRSSRKP
ncbi:MAG: 3'-5' exonuclease [Lentisphaerae bacterium]|nr:3'-5' exonuclease [Lentisphaerota bacterium]